ncbi:hypothetical protein BLA29_003775 [Euroglyphus maynei]|uniref:Uncharacterized protein n=1 Tax=Euroglyphus maynei TaxID=6958 RepID=A0A1Y3AYX1_EURMA|nr:hypothetical protein BLA29_003775 [Euroglyphus maynei]
MGEEANTPGTFCFKSIQQGPRGFIWDGRWRSVIRRCAQVSERGISWSCDWGYYENGVYWEECYCAEDNCNHATMQQYNPKSIITIIIKSNNKKKSSTFKVHSVVSQSKIQNLLESYRIR